MTHYHNPVPDHDLRELAESIPASYRGPWRWVGQRGLDYCLATRRNGIKWIMRFARLGMQQAQPMFPTPPEGAWADFDDPSSYRCGHMRKADELAVQEVDYRDDVVDIDNPFARWLAAATPDAVLAILDERDHLRDALTVLAMDAFAREDRHVAEHALAGVQDEDDCRIPGHPCAGVAPTADGDLAAAIS